jgi:hypothetical protein
LQRCNFSSEHDTMNININIKHIGLEWLEPIVTRFIKKVEKFMGEIDDRFKVVTDQLTTIGESLSDASTKITEGTAEILAELGKLREGGLTPEQDEALKGIEAKVGATSGVATTIDDAAKALAEISPPVGGEQPTSKTAKAAAKAGKPDGMG